MENQEVQNQSENKTPVVEGFSTFSQDDKYVWGLFIVYASQPLTEIPIIGLVLVIPFIIAHYILVKKDIEVLNKKGLKNPNKWWFLLPFVYVWQRCTIINPEQRQYFYFYMLMWAMYILSSIVTAFATVLELACAE